jgi:frataxin-like iron-binding protein CyaY
MSDNFYKLVPKLFSDLLDLVDGLNSEKILDIDHQSDTLEITTDLGLYLLNSKKATKQIWMVSPISGPQYFNLEDTKFVDKDGLNIFDVLKDEIIGYVIVKK